MSTPPVKIPRPCFVTMEFGSHVYGTATPSSDRDVKGIFFPTAEEILLQEIPRTASARTNSSDSGRRNGPDDVDFEAFSLGRFCQLLCEGQTVAHDMFFTPERHIRSQKKGVVGPLWYSMRREMAGICLSKKVGAAVGYSRAQAERYSARGDRITELQRVLTWMAGINNRELLGDLLAFAAAPPGKYIQHFERNGSMYMEVCGKASGYEATVGTARKIWQKQLDEYGHRARDAAKFDGADWKAFYHALRIPKQTTELLLTGSITFPRPEAHLLLEIRQGQLPYERVCELIEEATSELLAAQEKSTLPAEPDRAGLREYLIWEHAEIVKYEF